MTPVSAAAEPSEPGPDVFRPALFRELLPVLERTGVKSVLDVGALTPGSLAFFRQFRCRLGVSDALAELAEVGAGETAGSRLRWHHWRSAFPESGRNGWDVLLLWDLLAYLPQALLAELVDRLRAVLAPGALVYAIDLSEAPAVPATPRTYEILDRATLRLRGPETPTVAPQRHTPRRLRIDLDPLVVEHSRLYRDGRQEHLFRWTG